MAILNKLKEKISSKWKWLIVLISGIFWGIFGSCITHKSPSNPEETNTTSSPTTTHTSISISTSTPTPTPTPTPTSTPIPTATETPILTPILMPTIYCYAPPMLTPTFTPTAEANLNIEKRIIIAKELLNDKIINKKLYKRLRTLNKSI